MKEAMHAVWFHLHKAHNQTSPKSQKSGMSLWVEGRMEREHEPGPHTDLPSWTLAVHMCSASAGPLSRSKLTGHVHFSIYIYVIHA